MIEQVPSYRRRFANFLALVFCLCGFVAQGAPDPAPGHDLAVVGVVAPQNVAVTLEHPRVTRPVVVVIENRGSRQEIIPDVASLQAIIGLDVKSPDGPPIPQPALIPPKKFPIM